MTQISPIARSRLADILDVVNELEKIVQGRTLSEYTSSQEFRWGVERALEIVGKAMNQALKSDPQLITVIPNAREVTGMRNWLIHAYHDVDDDVVWNAATHAAPELADQIRAALVEDSRP